MLYTTDSAQISAIFRNVLLVRCIRDGQEGVRGPGVMQEESSAPQCSSKTKAMVVDYRRKRTTTGSITLMGQDVEQVDPYSYLGVYLDNKLGWKVDSEAV